MHTHKKIDSEAEAAEAIFLQSVRFFLKHCGEDEARSYLASDDHDPPIPAVQQDRFLAIAKASGDGLMLQALKNYNATHPTGGAFRWGY